ncbi:chemosensory pili system protein ChpC [Thioalbus denitrificans]|uniref:Chemosensory pili system protein ChpC n=2 Tax=Thioalbus denitrificans TaxID=547122 RepID=A0A369CEV3_9GAMM|nr:chemosensory pili system protein ChpC [Thioalbus denitrificans]
MTRPWNRRMQQTREEIAGSRRPAEVNCLLMPIGGGALLLPNILVAEVIGFSAPEPLADAPAWFAGRTEWRGLTVPLIRLETLLGVDAVPGAGRRIAILNALEEQTDTPFLGIVLQGIPALVRVRAAELEEDPEEGRGGPVLRRLRYQGQPVVVPDLEALTASLQAHVA